MSNRERLDFMRGASLHGPSQSVRKRKEMCGINWELLGVEGRRLRSRQRARNGGDIEYYSTSSLVTRLYDVAVRTNGGPKHGARSTEHGETEKRRNGESEVP